MHKDCIKIERPEDAGKLIHKMGTLYRVNKRGIGSETIHRGFFRRAGYGLNPPIPLTINPDEGDSIYFHDTIHVAMSTRIVRNGKLVDREFYFRPDS